MDLISFVKLEIHAILTAWVKCHQLYLWSQGFLSFTEELNASERFVSPRTHLFCRFVAQLLRDGTECVWVSSSLLAGGQNDPVSLSERETPDTGKRELEWAAPWTRLHESHKARSQMETCV